MSADDSFGSSKSVNVVEEVDRLSSLSPLLPDTLSLPDVRVQRRKVSGFFSKLVYFLVGNTLYNISDALLPGTGYLKSVKELAVAPEESSEASPFVLDVTTKEMDSIMSVLHAMQIKSPLMLSIEEWSNALHLSTIWGLDAAREHAIERITALFPDQPTIERIQLADRCGVTQWLHPAYETLCTRADPPTVEEGEKLGIRRLVALFHIREACRKTPPLPQNGQFFQCQYCGMQRTAYMYGASLQCGSCRNAISPAAPDAAPVARKLIGEADDLRVKPIEKEVTPEADPEAEKKSDSDWGAPLAGGKKRKGKKIGKCCPSCGT